jgi:hypothetical protein
MRRPPPGPRYLRVVRLRPRPDGEGGFLVPTLFCPFGHEVHANARLRSGDAIYHCRAVVRGRCNAGLYVVGGLTLPNSAPALLYAHAAASELAMFERRGFTLDDVLDYLAENPYPVDDDQRSA